MLTGASDTDDPFRGTLRGMAAKGRSVAELASAADLDNDETLIRLWDVGLLHYKSPTDRLRSSDLDSARRALALPTKSEITSQAYWIEHLGLTRDDFHAFLGRLGTPVKKQSSMLPKGSIAKLTRHVASIRKLPVPVETVASAQPTVIPPLQWKAVGRERGVRPLTAQEVEGIHWELVRDFEADTDPIFPAGLRSRNLLESAVFRQHSAWGDSKNYPTVEMVAAALFHSIVHDHPFHNENKRTALVAMLVLLDENGLAATCDENTLFQLVLRLARHALVPRGTDLSDREVLHVAEWLRDCTRPVEKGDHPLQWRKLRQILESYGCELAVRPGNRINVTRSIDQKARFGRHRQRILKTQVNLYG